MAEIIAANDGNFENYIRDNKTIIVDFWAPNCAPCRFMEPGLEEIALHYESNVMVVKVNVDENPKTSSRYLIRTLPTLLFIKDGQVKTQLIGAVNPKQIERTLAEVI